MKNTILSADEGLIEAARRRAAAEGTSLEALFRRWLAEYVGGSGRLTRLWRLFAICGRA